MPCMGISLGLCTFAMKGKEKERGPGGWGVRG